MDGYSISYAVISLISTILLAVTVYLIIFKSTPEMKIFKWVLLNTMVKHLFELKRVQVTAYLETIFWSLVFSPTIELFPLPILIPHGIGYVFLKISGKLLFVSFNKKT